MVAVFYRAQFSLHHPSRSSVKSDQDVRSRSSSEAVSNGFILTQDQARLKTDCLSNAKGRRQRRRRQYVEADQDAGVVMRWFARTANCVIGLVQPVWSLWDVWVRGNVFATDSFGEAQQQFLRALVKQRRTRQRNKRAVTDAVLEIHKDASDDVSDCEIEQHPDISIPEDPSWKEKENITLNKKSLSTLSSLSSLRQRHQPQNKIVFSSGDEETFHKAQNKRSSNSSSASSSTFTSMAYSESYAKKKTVSTFKQSCDNSSKMETLLQSPIPDPIERINSFSSFDPIIAAPKTDKPGPILQKPIPVKPHAVLDARSVNKTTLAKKSISESVTKKLATKTDSVESAIMSHAKPSNESGVGSRIQPIQKKPTETTKQHQQMLKQSPVMTTYVLGENSSNCSNSGNNNIEDKQRKREALVRKLQSQATYQLPTVNLAASNTPKPSFSSDTSPLMPDLHGQRIVPPIPAFQFPPFVAQQQEEFDFDDQNSMLAPSESSAPPEWADEPTSRFGPFNAQELDAAMEDIYLQTHTMANDEQYESVNKHTKSIPGGAFRGSPMPIGSERCISSKKLQQKSYQSTSQERDFPSATKHSSGDENEYLPPETQRVIAQLTQEFQDRITHLLTSSGIRMESEQKRAQQHTSPLDISQFERMLSVNKQDGAVESQEIPEQLQQLLRMPSDLRVGALEDFWASNRLQEDSRNELTRCRSKSRDWARREPHYDVGAISPGEPVRASSDFIASIWKHQQDDENQNVSFGGFADGPSSEPKQTLPSWVEETPEEVESSVFGGQKPSGFDSLYYTDDPTWRPISGLELGGSDVQQVTSEPVSITSIRQWIAQEESSGLKSQSERNLPFKLDTRLKKE